MNLHLPVRPSAYGSAQNEITALRERVAELEIREAQLLGVVDETRDAIRDLIRAFDNAQAVA